MNDVKYRDATGRIIPDDNFENDPGPVKDPAKFMPPKALAAFRVKTAEQRARVDKQIADEKKRR
jgi:hypothetical protein